jgi:endonuclease III
MADHKQLQNVHISTIVFGYARCTPSDVKCRTAVLKAAFNRKKPTSALVIT